MLITRTQQLLAAVGMGFTIAAAALSAAPAAAAAPASCQPITV